MKQDTREQVRVQIHQHRQGAADHRERHGQLRLHRARTIPKEPIAPGGTGEIEVVYKPGKQENAQQKTVTVVANTEPKQTILRIKANVQKVRTPCT